MLSARGVDQFGQSTTSSRNWDGCLSQRIASHILYVDRLTLSEREKEEEEEEEEACLTESTVFCCLFIVGR